VDLSNKREITSGKMRKLMQIKQKVCKIKTTYEFIGKDLQSFMASDLHDFMSSKTSFNKVYDYA
jgi:tyrosine-protein phosphatase YwqE